MEMHGEYGKLAVDGEKAQCHVCGEWFGHLGAHVARQHMTPDAYRKTFGLNASTGLIGPALRAKRVEDNSTPERLSILSPFAGKNPPPRGPKTWALEGRQKRRDAAAQRVQCDGCGAALTIPRHDLKSQRDFFCSDCDSHPARNHHRDEWRAAIRDGHLRRRT